jgi:hypothetical protein
MPTRNVPLCLLQAKQFLRDQARVDHCDLQLLEIMLMTDFVGLTELPEALREMTTDRLPTYWQLYRRATEEAFPTYHASGRIFVRQDDLTLIASIFGLMVKS